MVDRTGNMPPLPGIFPDHMAPVVRHGLDGRELAISMARPFVPNPGMSVVPYLGTCYTMSMQIIAKRTLRVFWESNPRAKTPLQTWFAMVSKSEWKGPADVKSEFGAAVDFVTDNRLIFDIGGNKFRLVVRVAYSHKRVLIKFVGTHADYDKIDAGTV